MSADALPLDNKANEPHSFSDENASEVGREDDASPEARRWRLPTREDLPAWTEWNLPDWSVPEWSWPEWMQDRLPETDDLDRWATWMTDSVNQGWDTVTDGTTLAAEETNLLLGQTNAWLAAKYDVVSEDARERSAALFDNLWGSASETTDFLARTTSEGAIRVYGVGTDGIARAVDWGQETYSQLTEIDYCDARFVDFAGGVVSGVTVASVFSGVNIAGAGIVLIPTVSGWLPVIAIATSPAIPAGVTLAAGTGVAIYATARGYCWWRGDSADLDGSVARSGVQ